MFIETIFNWIIDIPTYILGFVEWFQKPIYEPFINATPLELFTTAGATIVIAIIGVHIVRLFVG